jgi:hypothetical protein
MEMKNMATPRKMINVTADAHAALGRLAHLHGKSIAWLVEHFGTRFEQNWKSRMTEDEWRRHLDNDISLKEANEIRAREQGMEKLLNGKAKPATPAAKLQQAVHDHGALAKQWNSAPETLDRCSVRTSAAGREQGEPSNAIPITTRTRSAGKSSR